MDIETLKTTDYRDNIHLNNAGHSKLYKLFKPYLLEIISSYNIIEE